MEVLNCTTKTSNYTVEILGCTIEVLGSTTGVLGLSDVEMVHTVIGVEGDHVIPFSPP